MDTLDTTYALDTLKADLVNDKDLNLFYDYFETNFKGRTVSSEMTDQEKSDARQNNHAKRLNFINNILSTQVLVMLLLYYKNEEMNLFSMKEHLLCIDLCFNQLKSNTKLAKKLVLEEFLKLFRKLTLIIVGTKFKLKEKKTLLNFFKSWCKNYKNILKTVNASSGVNNLVIIYYVISELKSGECKPNLLIESIEALAHIKDINYYNKVFKLALKIYQEKFPEQITEQSFILECLKIDDFKTSYQLAKSIDKYLPKYFNVKECLNRESFANIYRVAEENIELLTSAFEGYLDTDIKILPEFNTSFLMVIYHFLKLFEGEDSEKGSKGGLYLRKYFKIYYLNNFFKLTQIITTSSLYSPFNRFIATELLQLAAKKGDFDFFCFFSRLNAEFDPSILPEELVEIFIKKALEFPYHIVLLKFFKPSSSLEELENALREAISKVRITDLPKSVCGVTLSNMTICLPNTDDSNFGNGVKFYVLLHELVHFLQRTSIESFRESLENKNQKLIGELKMSNLLMEDSIENAEKNPTPEATDINPLDNYEILKKIEENEGNLKPLPTFNPAIDSSQNTDIKEGGEYLELLLFNGLHERIYTSAAEFLFESHENSLEKFREKFSTLNANGMKNKENYYPIRELGSNNEEVYYLGECGTKERMIAYKIYMDEKNLSK
ncbi:hypothetical protein SteCoe_22826 [Stentor coeruleus]|uniref:Uncharacterized protein n=1 Tax=Stentor coeruleus TaxID=5963 RepID=A0A1R2BLC5_9CILI|nr:hypothetical protein SteCoe_22826 [Stentor coeruleus]